MATALYKHNFPNPLITCSTSRSSSCFSFCCVYPNTCKETRGYHKKEHSHTHTYKYTDTHAHTPDFGSNFATWTLQTTSWMYWRSSLAEMIRHKHHTYPMATCATKIFSPSLQCKELQYPLITSNLNNWDTTTWKYVKTTTIMYLQASCEWKRAFNLLPSLQNFNAVRTYIHW